MEIHKDSMVSFDYTLTNKNEEIIDSSAGSGPFSYLHGYEEIISGLEKALEGKDEGDAFKVKIQAADAYGERDENLVFNVPLERFQNAAEHLEAGMQFEAETPDGSRLVTVKGIDGGFATIDANHPLAGEELCFDVTVAAVRKATSEELEERAHRGCSGCGSDCGSGCGSSCSCGSGH